MGFGRENNLDFQTHTSYKKLGADFFQHRVNLQGVY